MVKRSDEWWERRGVENLEPGIVGHLLLSLESLFKAQEDISVEAICLPVTTSLYKKRVSSKTIKVGRPTPPEGVTTIAASFESSSIQKSPQLFSEPIIGDALNSVILLVAEGREVVIKSEPVEELLHVEYWTKRLKRVGHHWNNHVVVPKLVCLAMGQ